MGATVHQLVAIEREACERIEVRGDVPRALPRALLTKIAAALRGDNADPFVPGRVYEESLAESRASRRAEGAFYTPRYIVDAVVERTLPARVTDAAGTVLDPSCGGAVFLLAAHRRGVPGHRLLGIDVDPTAIAVSRLALAMAGADGATLVLGDALDDATTLPEPPQFIVGNPPWGQKGLRFEASVAARLRARFRSASGVLDPFKLFVERATELVLPGGRWGMVLPDIVLLKNHEVLRQLLLERCRLDWIAHAGRAFADVNLDAVVIVATRRPAPAAHRVSIWHTLPAQWRESPPLTRSLPQAVFHELAGRRFNIYLTDASLALLQKLASLPRFGSRFEAHEGVHTGNARKKLFHREPGANRVQVVVGRRELARYRLDWHGTWLDLAPNALDRDAGDYANLGRPEWHRAPKLIVRRTGDHIVAAQDKRGYYLSNNAFVVLAKQPMTDAALAGHLALLNSRFMTWYFRTVQPRVGRIFAELKIQHLVDFPLPSCGVEALAALVAQVEPLAALESRDPAQEARLADLLRQLDEAVADCFELSASERLLVGEATPS